MSQLIVQIYKLSHSALRTQARVVKVKHALLYIVSQEQNITTTTKPFSRESTRKGRQLNAVTFPCCS